MTRGVHPMCGHRGRATEATFVAGVAVQAGSPVVVPGAAAVEDFAVIYASAQSLSGGAANGGHWAWTGYLLSSAYAVASKSLESADLGASLTVPSFGYPTVMLIYRGPTKVAVRGTTMLETLPSNSRTWPGFVKARNSLGLVGLAVSAGSSVSAAFGAGPSAWTARADVTRPPPPGGAAIRLTGVDALIPPATYADETTFGMSATGTSPAGGFAAIHYFNFLELLA